MEFSKVSEQNAWDSVAAATDKVRNGSDVNNALLDWFRSHDVLIEHSVFPTIGVFADGIFSGTLINQDRRVIEYFVELDDPEEGEFEDVTDELGPKDPSHPDSDIKDLITMSLVFYDAQRNRAA